MHRVLIFLFLFFLSFSAYSKEYINNPKLLGKGQLKYYFWHLYDAYLYSSDEFSFDQPFYLSLEYKRKINGKKIADISAEKIRKLGFKDEEKLSIWHDQMLRIFPDVEDGIILTGIYQPNSRTIFYKDKLLLGEVKDPDFGKWFFGIWLNKNTTEKELRKKLLGEDSE